jgi:hypothetical protein
MKRPKTKYLKVQKKSQIEYQLVGVRWFGKGMENLEGRYRYLLVVEVIAGVVILIMGLIVLMS